jgi:hypothetical protein
VNFINEWRSYIEVILPHLDLYPNYTKHSKMKCVCSLGPITLQLHPTVLQKCPYHAYLQSITIAKFEAYTQLFYKPMNSGGLGPTLEYSPTLIETAKSIIDDWSIKHFSTSSTTSSGMDSRPN